MEFTQRAVYQQTVTADAISEVEVPTIGPSKVIGSRNVIGSTNAAGAAATTTNHSPDTRREVKLRNTSLGRTAPQPPPGTPYYNPITSTEDAIEPELGRVTREFCLSSLVETRKTKLATKRELQLFREHQQEVRVIKIKDALDEEEAAGTAVIASQPATITVNIEAHRSTDSITNGPPPEASKGNVVGSTETGSQDNPVATSPTPLAMTTTGDLDQSAPSHHLLRGYESETSSSDYNCSSSEG